MTDWKERRLSGRQNDEEMTALEATWPWRTGNSVGRTIYACHVREGGKWAYEGVGRTTEGAE